LPFSSLNEGDKEKQHFTCVISKDRFANAPEIEDEAKLNESPPLWRIARGIQISLSVRHFFPALPVLKSRDFIIQGSAYRGTVRYSQEPVHFDGIHRELILCPQDEYRFLFAYIGNMDFPVLS
jgi:hypothetical protein